MAYVAHLVEHMDLVELFAILVQVVETLLEIWFQQHSIFLEPLFQMPCAQSKLDHVELFLRLGEWLVVCLRVVQTTFKRFIFRGAKKLPHGRSKFCKFRRIIDSME